MSRSKAWPSVRWSQTWRCGRCAMSPPVKTSPPPRPRSLERPGQVYTFLSRHGIDTTAVQLQALEVSDAFANRYQGERGGPRYIIQQTVMVRSDRPQVVMAASQKVSELVTAGVVLSSSGEFGIGGPTFVFTLLNQLKPAMVAEATANARAAAQQFAADSKSSVGDIRQASQGVFVILPRDQAPGVNEGAQLQKTVRVVSTVQYFLK